MCFYILSDTEQYSNWSLFRVFYQRLNDYVARLSIHLIELKCKQLYYHGCMKPPIF